MKKLRMNKERRGKEDEGSMDTGTGRLVGIGLSVLWYRVIVQRNIEWLFKQQHRNF